MKFLFCVENQCFFLFTIGGNLFCFFLGLDLISLISKQDKDLKRPYKHSRLTAGCTYEFLDFPSSENSGQINKIYPISIIGFNDKLSKLYFY